MSARTEGMVVGHAPDVGVGGLVVLLVVGCVIYGVQAVGRVIR